MKLQLYCLYVKYTKDLLSHLVWQNNLFIILYNIIRLVSLDYNYCNETTESEYIWDTHIFTTTEHSENIIIIVSLDK